MCIDTQTLFVCLCVGLPFCYMCISVSLSIEVDTVYVHLFSDVSVLTISGFFLYFACFLHSNFQRLALFANTSSVGSIVTLASRLYLIDIELPSP